MRKTISIVFAVLFALLLMACGNKTTTTTVDTYDYSGNPQEGEITKLNTFTYGDVKINDSLFNSCSSLSNFFFIT